MSDKKAEAALQRWDDMSQTQRLWLNLWQELADYIQPRKGNIAFKRSSAQQQTERLFDSTAIHANELLAASMQGALTSASFRWFSLRLKGVELMRDHDVSVALEACSDDMYDAFMESNFMSETHELYLDAPCFGTAGIFVDEKSASTTEPAGSLRFTALPPGSFAIDEDESGYVDTLFRTFQMSARTAAATFGDKVGAQVTAALKQNASQRFDFLHCVYPRTDAGLNMKKALPATKMPYASLWVDVSGRVIVRESGYQEMPMLAPRWTKTSGEIYGRGPGVVSLPDIKTLNKAVELKLKAWAKVVDPALMARDEGVLSDIHLENGGITYVRDMESIKALTELGGNLNVADMEEGKIREAIRRMFFSDQLQLQEGPQMTAYEVQVRYELMQRILGPTLGRLQVEYLNPLINRVFWIRLRAAGKQSPYQVVLQWCRANGISMDVEYEGPLAKAQRLQESVSMQRFFQIALPLFQVKPELADLIDFDTVLAEHAVSVGVPTKILIPKEQVAAVRAARTAAQNQMAKQQAMAQAAQAGGQVAPLVKALSDAKGAGAAGASGPGPGQAGSLIPQPAGVLGSG